VRRVGEALRRLAVAQPSGTHIQPVIVGSDKSALALAERMQAHGHDIRAIRPPTVPEGTARLRISLTLNVSDVQTDAMIALLAQELAKRRHECALRDCRNRHRGRENCFLRRAHRRAGRLLLEAGAAGPEGRDGLACVLRLSGLPPERILPEAYRLETPASPHLAARLDGLAIDPSRLDPPDTAGPLVIETAGGVMTPLTIETPTIDLLTRWRLPVIVVARTALGTINHSLLTMEALRRRDIPLRGVAFIGEANEDTQDTIARMGRVAMLGRLPNLTR